ncbi:MAG: hypothetical protein HY390_06480 [Deltaproteobacteria bacterium]|nr:hypothetical protein [Deltaproteobacteria bacterium]
MNVLCQPYLKNKKGQSLTEFLFIFVLLLFLILAHVQLSLTYVASHVMRYAGFMTARSESVSGNSSLYLSELVGSPQNNRLGFLASPLTIPGQHVIRDAAGERIELTYQVLSYIPLLGTLGNPLQTLTVASPFTREPGPAEVRSQSEGVLDNE